MIVWRFSIVLAIYVSGVIIHTVLNGNLNLWRTDMYIGDLLYLEAIKMWLCGKKSVKKSSYVNSTKERKEECYFIVYHIIIRTQIFQFYLTLIVLRLKFYQWKFEPSIDKIVKCDENQF